MKELSVAEIDRKIAKAKATLRDLKVERQAVLHGGMAALKAKYVAGEVPICKLAASFGMSYGKLTRLVRQRGWPHRLPCQSKSQQARREREANA